MSVLSLGHRMRCWLVVAAFIASVLAPQAHAQEADGPKQVVVLNSTRLDDQFSVTWARELPKLLGDGLPEGVDFYAEYFDFVRYARPEYESAYLDLLRLKYGGRPTDLVIVIGALALDFMSRHRKDLFPGTPVVSYSLTPSTARLANSTGLFNPIHHSGSIELALALQPDLERVYVVSGAGVPDRTYESEARAEFRALERRLEFTYLSGLAMPDLERQLRALPPRSAVYYVVVRQDGAGQRFQVMDALARVASAANAPTYSWADAAVETGIVGGSRRDQLAQTKAIAALALRVLRGERVDDIPVSSLDTDVDQVDWRQLRRWGIDESRVPAGTAVLFRAPGMWEQYRRYIIAAVMLILAQTALIAGLLVQRAKRQRAERVLRRSQVKLRLSYDRIRDLSRRLLGEQETERARIARELHDDINQQLTLLALELDRFRRADPLRIDTAQRLSRALQAVHGIATSVRELSHRLHPSRLQLIGLVAGLDNLRRDLSPPHLPIAFHHRDVPPDVDSEIALCLFRVTQEALVNAVKHSEAGRVAVDLTAGPSSLELTITDDGKGFDVDCALHGGLGLISMRERVESVGGVLEICATPPRGTRLTVTVPIRLPEPALAAVPSA